MAPHSKAGAFAIGGGKQGSATPEQSAFSLQQLFALRNLLFPSTPVVFHLDSLKRVKNRVGSRIDGDDFEESPPCTRGSAPAPPPSVGMWACPPGLKFTHASRSITDALPGAEFKCYEAQEESTSLPRRAVTKPPPGGLS